MAPSAFDDPEVDALVFRIAEAGFQLRLYDQTRNSGLPVIYAVLSPGDGADKHFDAATGASCHPVPGIAARRAIVEAAQTRITNIAGARDDIFSQAYVEDPAARAGAALLSALSKAAAGRSFHDGPDFSSDDIGEDLQWCLRNLATAGAASCVMVDLTREDLGIPVVRTVIPGLTSCRALREPG